MGKIVKCHLKGKTCSKLANGLNFHDLKNEIDSGLALVIYMYITIIVKQVYLYLRSQVRV